MYDGMGVQLYSANVLTSSLAAHLGFHLTVNVHVRVGQAVCARGKITFHMGIVHSDLQEVCGSSRIVTALVLKFAGACWGATASSTPYPMLNT